jgi:formylglycine-generating enzyme
MSRLGDQLAMASYRWQQLEANDHEASKRWKEIRWLLFTGSQSNLDQALYEMRRGDWHDAVCSLLELDGLEQAGFSSHLPGHGRQIASMGVLAMASQSPTGHILQELLAIGGLDRMLVTSVSSLNWSVVPEWIQERLIVTLSSMVTVDEGVYGIGNPGSAALADERRLDVSLSDYEIGVYPVSQALYEMVLEKNPSSFAGASNPVDFVNWREAVRFCNALSEKVGLEPAYVLDRNKTEWNTYSNGYRLLTEAEWEVAARSERGHGYSGSDDIQEVGWSVESECTGTKCVGTKNPNAWGVFDMSGNVFEWVWDWYGPYPETAVHDPSGPETGERRVRRGGSWMSVARGCEVWYRSDRSPGYRSENTGFRIGRSLY